MRCACAHIRSKPPFAPEVGQASPAADDPRAAGSDPPAWFPSRGWRRPRPPPAVWGATPLVIAALQVGAELLVGRNYGVAMLCVTPLALLMGQAAQPRPTAGLLFDRGVETIIGAVVGVAVVLAAHRLRSPRRIGR